MGKPLTFDKHDHADIVSEVKLCSIKSEYAYSDLMFVKIVKINCIPCNDIVSIFQDRTLSYSLRDFRPVLESESAKEYVYYASVNRIKHKYNKLPISIRNFGRVYLFKISARKYTQDK